LKYVGLSDQSDLSFSGHTVCEIANDAPAKYTPADSDSGQVLCSPGGLLMATIRSATMKDAV